MSRRPSEPADRGALSGSAIDLAHAFVSLSSDIALIIDAQGRITRVVQNAKAPMSASAQAWVGRLWVDTVTDETRRKVEMLLADVAAQGLAKQRQVNHASDDRGVDIPVAYTALRLSPQGPVLAVGRDLRAVAAIQQRFQNTQQELERSYWRLRQSESRCRLLFQVATDAVLVVDARSMRILEGNHAAAVLLCAEPGPLVGRVAEHQFDASSRPAVGELLARASQGGPSADIQVRLAGTHIPMSVAATAFRPPTQAAAQPHLLSVTDTDADKDAGGDANTDANTDADTDAGTDAGTDATTVASPADAVRVLLRVRASEPPDEDLVTLQTPLARLVDTTAEGIVVTDATGRLVVANRAFAHLVFAENAQALAGQDLARWLGANGDELPALIQRVRGQGIAQLAQVRLRREQAPALLVGLTVTLLTDGDAARFGFTLRPQMGLAPDKAPAQAPVVAAPLQAQTLTLAQAIEALCSSLGEAPLGALLQRAEHLARSHLVQQALHREAVNEKTAAMQLGISVQELSRLRREQDSVVTQAPT
jgi:PAS domain-containing protein